MSNINRLVYEALNNLFESFIFSNDDICIDFDSWVNGSKNVLFIIGLIGSGKTTLAKKISEKYKAEIIPLDQFWYQLYGNKYDSKSDNELSDEFWKQYSEKLYDYCKSFFNKKEKYIIEGIQIINYPILLSLTENNPIIFVNSSITKSAMQQYGRFNQYSKNKIKDIPSLLSHAGIRNYKLDQEFNKYKENRIKQGGTITLLSSILDK